MLTVDEENYLRRIWTAPKHAGSFTGPEKLYHIVKKERKYKIGVYRIKQFLADQDSHSLQKRVQRKFKRNHIIVQGIDTQCDVDMQSLAKSNDGIQYILVAQDVFSRFVFAVPMKQKTATQTIKALETLFSTGRKPKLLRTDKGRVHIFYTQNETKSSFAERSIQNSKNRLYRMFTESQSYEYIKELLDIVQSINDTPSRPLGNVAPSNVHKNNEDKIRLNAYLVQTKIKLHTKMKIKTHSKKSMSRRIVLRSKDSINFYPDNECYSFRVHLPRPLLLDGNWSLSLLELTFQGQQPADPEFYVHCNLCSDTIVGDREVPLLRYMFMDTPELSSDGRMTLKETHDYWHQIQGQLFLTGTQCCDFVLWTPKDLQIVRIVKDMSWSPNISLKKMKQAHLLMVVTTVRKKVGMVEKTGITKKFSI
ncbi:hypothetical protein KUTeg_003037 [Tegillarca granosa]|uniref:Integrase catalytic domain-containing protein n=1 Tax=Tegillarca granosa TaxID=220873 RepID=A0ABQ9FKY9_TEGGR|nr:hypothetical protein KUTeg_003037 [Tegillarca granosa]